MAHYKYANGDHFRDTYKENFLRTYFLMVASKDTMCSPSVPSSVGSADRNRSFLSRGLTVLRGNETCNSLKELFKWFTSKLYGLRNGEHDLILLHELKTNERVKDFNILMLFLYRESIKMKELR